MLTDTQKQEIHDETGAGHALISLVELAVESKSLDAERAKVESLEDLSDSLEEELHCCEEVLDAFAAELPEEPFNNAFDCMGDYITAVVNGFKAKLEATQSKLDAATAQMEKQKDEWLAWEAKRKDLEQRAALPDSVPMPAYRRKGLDSFVTCSQEQHDELAQKPALFEVAKFVRVL